MPAVLRLAGTTGIDIVSGLTGDEDGLRAVDETADLILISRDAQSAGLAGRFSRPDRIRSWTYEFDPAGIELLRRAIEHVVAERPTETASTPESVPTA
jgi:hypothetical protein